MKDLVKGNSIDAISSNVETLLETIGGDVTVDNIKETKNTMAKLNKIPATIKEEFKEELKRLKEPYEVLRKKIKSIEESCENAREPLKLKVKSFEDGARLEHSQKMIEYFNASAVEKGIREEFLGTLMPEASIAGLTSTGNLIKKYRDLIDSIVDKQLLVQKDADTQKEIQRLKDEARAEEILREREEKATGPTRDAKVNAARNDHPTATADHRSVNALEKSDDGKSLYKVTKTTITTEVLYVKAKPGVNSDIILDKTASISKFDEEFSNTTRICEEIV